MLHLLAMAYAFVQKGAPERIRKLQVLGRTANFLFLQAQRPGQQMVVDATRLLREAWATIAARHAVLRTRFRWEDVERPEQQVLDRIEVDITEHDLRALDPDRQREELARFGRDDRRRGIDMAKAPMWRLNVFRLAPQRCRFVFTYHHSILDGVTAGVTGVFLGTDFGWRLSAQR